MGKKNKTEHLHTRTHTKNEQPSNSFRFVSSVWSLKPPAVFLELGDRENKQENVEISLALETWGDDVPEAPGILVPGHWAVWGSEGCWVKDPGLDTVLNSLCSEQQYLTCLVTLKWVGFGGASYTFLSRAVSHQRHQETQSGSWAAAGVSWRSSVAERT